MTLAWRPRSAAGHAKASHYLYRVCCLGVAPVVKHRRIYIQMVLYNDCGYMSWWYMICVIRFLIIWKIDWFMIWTYRSWIWLGFVAASQTVIYNLHESSPFTTTKIYWFNHIWSVHLLRKKFRIYPNSAVAPSLSNGTTRSWSLLLRSSW